MTLSDLLTYIQAEVDRYNGAGTLYFGSGTIDELNAIEQIQERNALGYPLVWLVEDPDMLSVRSSGQGRKEFIFNLLILFKSTLDAPPSETEELYQSAGLIGEGLIYNLAENASNYGYNIHGWEAAPKLKFNDSALTGCVFRITLTAPLDFCLYPFS